MRMEFINGECPCGKTYKNIRNMRQYNKMRELHEKKCEICKNFTGDAILKTSIERVLVKTKGGEKRTSLTSVERTQTNANTNNIIN